MKYRTFGGLAIAACVFMSICVAKSGNQVSQEELVRRAQELADAVAVGDRRPWTKYFAEDCIFFDEKGRSMDKKALVADVTPLPRDYSGRIKIENVHSHIEEALAILSYDQDETEIIYGQVL